MESTNVFNAETWARNAITRERLTLDDAWSHATDLYDLNNDEASDLLLRLENWSNA